MTNEMVNGRLLMMREKNYITHLPSHHLPSPDLPTGKLLMVAMKNKIKNENKM